MAGNNSEQTDFYASPEMLHIERRCASTASNDYESLKKMDIDRRWNEDNRIPMWNFGMTNFGFDQNFLYGGNSICLTDDDRQTITEDNNDEEGESRKVTGHRYMTYNGNWFNLPSEE